MSEDMSFEVEVRTSVPAAQYRVLAEMAEENRTTVKALVRECVRRVLGPVESIRSVQTPRKKPAAKVEPAGAASRKRPPRAAFTDEELLRLRELVGQGMSDTLIAAELGRSQPAVSARRRSMGIPANFQRVGGR